MAYLKNIPFEDPFRMADQVSVLPGQVVSKTLVQNGHVGITVFAFSAGEEISTHASPGDALVTVLEGRGSFTVDGNEYNLGEGESLVMPAGKPHAVNAPEDFKMLLTVVFP